MLFIKLIGKNMSNRLSVRNIFCEFFLPIFIFRKHFYAICEFLSG